MVERSFRLWASVAAAGLLLGAGAVALARDSSFAEVMRGRYLVYAGDCAACHTDDRGKPFAGGRAVPTPFGTIYSTNITPDRETGIGKWSEEDFWNAMHNGIRRDGSHLYPAFPYPWYTKLGRGDVLAIRSYLNTLDAVRQENKPPELPWPMSWRGSLAIWNTLFFKPGTYEWNPNKSEQWNRGAYLVEGLGHCGACHSPKNLLGAVKKDHALEGGMGEGWFATSLRPASQEGLGAWSVDEIVEYLKTGAVNRARAMGPMAEVVHNSTHYLNDYDLHAMAMYLKDQPAASQDHESPSSDKDVLSRGRLVYIDQCAGCHRENGEGIPGVFPPVKGNSGANAHDPTSLARLVLEGAPSVGTTAKPERFAMPGFDWKLNDQEVADVLTYIRASFGNQAGAVSASKVADVRKQLEH
ncbi:MAG TPA: cytochrome c [Casimicrobiaceae bacterium]|nr:cytochrome c [Casimicrobiaceae bacterium]